MRTDSTSKTTIAEQTMTSPTRSKATYYSVATSAPPMAPRDAQARRRKSKRAQFVKVVVAQLLLIVGVLGLWQLAAIFEWGRSVLVRSPIEVFQAFIEMSGSGELWGNYWATLWASLLALVISVAIGAPLGLVVGTLPFTSRVLTPIINALNATPRIALAPVLIVIFGIEPSAKVALAVSLAIFVVFLNALAGMQAADPEAVRMLTVMGANRGEILWKAILPSAVPSLIAGIRLAMIFSLLGVVSSELIASKDGLGQMIIRSSLMFDMAGSYAILILLVITAALLNLIGDWAERRLLRWQPPRVQ